MTRISSRNTSLWRHFQIFSVVTKNKCHSRHQSFQKSQKYLYGLVKRRVIVDDSWFSPNYHQLDRSNGQMAKEVRDSWHGFFTGSRASKVTRAASSKLFPRKNANTKWHPVRQTCKSMNYSRRKRAPACFLTAVLIAIGPVITKTTDRKTIMYYHTRGQTRKTIIDYHEEFEQAQKLNDSWW